MDLLESKGVYLEQFYFRFDYSFLFFLKSSQFFEKHFSWDINELIEEINPKHKYRSDYYRFYEKLMGIIYFYAIQNIGPKSDHYNVTICHESYMDIWTLINVIHNLAKKTGWKIECTTSVRKNEHLLKMADYVAGANRKLEQHQLNSIERHTILSSPINDIDLKRIFHIWPDRIKISK